MEYGEFIESKSEFIAPVGMDASDVDIHPMLFEFQRDIVLWALRRGRAAIFADCGLGKTFMQIEWARITGQRTLILAPLCVAKQTKAEGEKIGVPIHYTRDGADLIDGINITNYEMLSHFNAEDFGAIVLDESSILKNYGGKIRQAINKFAANIPFRLACTATPAPNDILEIINHAEYLGIMSGKEIIALFFIQDGNTTHRWKLKGHAEKDFWKWMASWCVALRSPRDLGYDDDTFNIPPLRFHEHVTDNRDYLASKGVLFEIASQGIQERRQARRSSLDHRVLQVAKLVNASDEPWVVWCDLNAESDALAKAIPDAVEVRGSDSIDHKEGALTGFATGEHRVMVTKPSIAGFGLNWQHCHNIAFTGLSDSYEQFYQAMRRCWRFGQEYPVECHIVIGEAEGEVLKNIRRKERAAGALFDGIISEMRDLTEVHGMQKKHEAEYIQRDADGEHWKLLMGDCVERIQEIPDNSIGLSVFSPPFPGMYAYSNSARDVGNAKDIEELLSHLQYLWPELLRVLKPGRSCAIHLTQMVRFQYLEGVSGLRDFRGRVIDALERAGFTFYGEVTIDKNPQLKAQRTKDHGLLFKTLAADSAKMHMCLADYMLQFRKPGENPEPIHAGTSVKYDNEGWITQEEWIEWAAPVWYRKTPHYPGGISEMDVLEYRQGKDEKDEKHICPLQLGVIERAIKLWSNPGDIILDPFNGIGSTGHQAIALNREYIGIELKESYFNQAIRNLNAAKAGGAPLPIDQYLEESA